MSQAHRALGPGPEFDRIRGIAARLGAAAASLGDDCAIVPTGEGQLVLSTDMSVEGVHFERDWLSLTEVGWRAAMGALSDLAAAGASCVGALAAVVCPRTSGPADVVSVMGGVGDAVQAAGGQVLGGDLTGGDRWTLCLTVVGRAARPMTRAGALPGDGLWVTGELGGARAAVVLWQAGTKPDAATRARFARPEARLRAGVWLAGHGAHAMLDLSDGLAGDAAHLAAASRVAIRVALERLPIHPGVAEAVRRTGIAPEAFAAEGGEDYELLVALPPDFAEEQARQFTETCGTRLTRIGDVASGTGLVLELHGRPLALAGYDHFV